MVNSETISPVLQWLNAHPNLAGLAAFLISAAESIAIIGTIIPGSVTMAAVGTLIGAGVIPFWSTIIWAIFGAILGDNVSFWTGFYFKDRIRRLWPFNKYPTWLTTGEKFFHRHGSKSILIGRFIGPVRALVPLVAGMLHMNPMRFIVTSIIASAMWAPAYMLPGILLGAATLELPPDIAAHMMLKLLLIGFLIVLCVWVTVRILVLVSVHTHHVLNKFWQRLNHSPYFRVVTKALRHHDPVYTHGQLTLGFYFFVCGCLFLYLCFYLLHHNAAAFNLNNAFFHLFRSIRTPALDSLMLWITMLGDKKVLMPIVGLVLIYLALKKYWHTFLHVFILAFLAAGSIFVFKHLVHEHRPWGILSSPESFSFPSGHATLSLAFYFGFGLLLLNLARSKTYKLVFATLGFIVLAISLSRIYLGAHWFTDVFGGWLLSSALLMLVTLSYNRRRQDHVSPKILFLILLFTLIPYSVLIYHFEKKHLQHNYQQIEWPSLRMSENDWWQHQRSNMPLFRVGRIGTPIEILNIQWEGNLNKIRDTLLQQGWSIPNTENWVDILHRITDVSSTDHLPIAPPLYLDKEPVLVLIKKIDDKKLIVLRLWDSNIHFSSTPEPLWVGVVNTIPRTYSWILRSKRAKVFDLDSKILFTNPPVDFEVKRLEINTQFRKTNHIIHILLIRSKK